MLACDRVLPGQLFTQQKRSLSVCVRGTERRDRGEERRQLGSGGSSVEARLFDGLGSVAEPGVRDWPLG